MDKVEKILKNMNIELINLEIQVAQLEDDAAARGAMVAVEQLRKEISELSNIIK